MTNYERMIKGIPYDPADKEIVEEQAVFQKELVNFNRLDSTDEKSKQEYMKRVFGDCGDNCYIELPFYSNWGGHHLHLGKNVYANFGLTCVDDGHIYVGDYTLFGPHVTLATANHCIEPGLRKKGYQYNKDIHIGNNVWIAANVSILPGVTIGDNSVIGAGSVVNKDIPANVIAVGCPCRVIREIGERDREYFYKDEKIDWENL